MAPLIGGWDVAWNRCRWDPRNRGSQVSRMPRSYVHRERGSAGARIVGVPDARKLRNAGRVNQGIAHPRDRAPMAPLIGGWDVAWNRCRWDPRNRGSQVSRMPRSYVHRERGSAGARIVGVPDARKLRNAGRVNQGIAHPRDRAPMAPLIGGWDVAWNRCRWDPRNRGSQVSRMPRSYVHRERGSAGARIVGVPDARKLRNAGRVNQGIAHPRDRAPMAPLIGGWDVAWNRCRWDPRNRGSQVSRMPRSYVHRERGSAGARIVGVPDARKLRNAGRVNQGIAHPRDRAPMAPLIGGWDVAWNRCRWDPRNRGSQVSTISAAPERQPLEGLWTERPSRPSLV